MGKHTLAGICGLTVIVLVGCDRVPPLAPEGEPSPNLAVSRGEIAFVAECARCHASRDGFDLAFFHFPDTTIVRRAVAHVTEDTALDIVAYIESLHTDVSFRDDRPFQPTDAVLPDDRSFAIRLFGMDGIPATLDSDALRGIDPLQVAVAVPMPQWSIEESDLDWMPDGPLPDPILDDRGSLARLRLERYYSDPTTDNLVSTVAALRTADRRMDGPNAPCLLNEPTRVDHPACFEVRRWTASLVGQHMLRHRMSGPVHPILHDAWWDVGNVARKAFNSDIPLKDAEMNWPSWMYLGWMFDPGRHASIYTGLGLNRMGLPRHATFVALKSLVSRRDGSAAVWPDARSAAQFAPPGWAFDATRLAYEHLLERLANGERPEDEEARVEARMFVERAYTLAARKVDAEARVTLGDLRDAILSALG